MSGTYASSVSTTITAEEDYSNALMFVHGASVNVGHGNCSLSGVTSSEQLYRLNGDNYLDGFVFKFSCVKDSVITVTISHSNTGGGTSTVSALILA